MGYHDCCSTLTGAKLDGVQVSNETRVTVLKTISRDHVIMQNRKMRGKVEAVQDKKENKMEKKRDLR